jgi:hypothetical protein
MGAAFLFKDPMVRAMATGFFGPANASAREVTTLWMPMIRVSLSNATNNEAEHIVDDDVLALIDTGSDLCRIDDEMVNKYQFKPIGTTQTVTPTGRGAFKVYLVQMILDRHRLMLYCPAVPLRRYEGAIYDILLGMDAIRYFDLTVSRVQSLVTLSWIQS